MIEISFFHALELEKYAKMDDKHHDHG